jgi:cytochrome c biogenesis protein CcdA
MKAYRRCDIRPRRRPFEGYAMHDVSIPAALIAGLISFLSPCVLPLVPPYLI